MADLTPGAGLVSFGGTTIASISQVAAVGFPSVDRQPVEAYEQILGNALPVDLFNGFMAPRKDVVTLQLLVRAQNSTTDPAAAWIEVMTGYRALAGMPETGTLVITKDPGAGTTVSCTARRKPLPIALSPRNARHLVVDLTFTLLSDWS